ncbi:hypothetical protein F4X33_03380 [Candidatus Poribacteria bacterium]|nr:hypothetical protein [Candidatus Poribacteria bacterium]
MKLYSWFSKLMILVMLFIPISLTHAITMPLEIHELVDEADIVVIGTVTSSLLVTNNVSTLSILDRRLGTLYGIHVDRVLYGKGAVKQGVFSESDTGTINMNLKRNCKRSPLKIYAFQSSPLNFSEGATYYKNRPQLFFLKTSAFPTSLPETALIVSRSPLQRLSKADLTETYYFEACFGIRQSTWDLAQQQQKTELPTVEAFCAVMSITDTVQRKQRLQGLLNDDDALLARNARAALKKIEQSRRE